MVSDEITEYADDGRVRSPSELSAMNFARQREGRNRMLNPIAPTAAPPLDHGVEAFKSLFDLASVLAAKGAPAVLKDLHDAAETARTEQERAKIATASLAVERDKHDRAIADELAAHRAAMRAQRDETDEYSKQARAGAAHAETELKDREAKLVAAEREVGEMRASLKRKLDSIRAAAS